MIKGSFYLTAISFLSLVGEVATADELGFQFYIACETQVDGCDYLPFATKSGGVSALASSRMDLFQEEILVADRYLRDDGDQIQLALKPSAQDKVEQFTKANVGKQLVLVTGDKAIFASKVQQAIRSDFLVVGGGKVTSDYLLSVPWIRKKWEDRSGQEGSGPPVLLTFIPAIIFFAIAAFLYKRRRPKPSYAPGSNR